jgi:DNA-directed RNA polymerase subunit F
MEIKGSKAVTVSEAKEILTKRKGEQAELGYEQSQALEHAERFSKMDADKSRKLVEKISKAGKLSHEVAVKIVDIHPSTVASLRAILSKDKIELSEEDAAKVLKELA